MESRPTVINVLSTTGKIECAFSDIKRLRFVLDGRPSRAKDSVAERCMVSCGIPSLSSTVCGCCLTFLTPYPTCRSHPPPFSGIVTIERGYDILRDIKKLGGYFRPQPLGDIIEPKCWIIKAGSDERARSIAKELKTCARSSGLHAQVDICFKCFLSYFVVCSDNNFWEACSAN